MRRRFEFDLGPVLERELEHLTPFLNSKATKRVWSFTVSAEIAGHPWQRSFKSPTYGEGHSVALVMGFRLRHWNFDPAILVTNIQTEAISPRGKKRAVL